MKIALINAPLLPVPPVLGGPIEQTLFETALAIRRPKLAVISPWAKEVPSRDESLFYHVDIRAQERHVRTVLGRRMPRCDRRTARDFYYLNGITDWVETLKPDVLQVHNFPQGMAYLARQFPGLKKVLYMHNQMRYGDAKTAEAVHVSDHLVFVSHYLARQCRSHFPGSETKTTVIYNSVDVTTFQPGLGSHPRTQAIREKYDLSEGRIALFVGRTVPVKGLHHLLSAMKKVQAIMPDAKLMIVGSPLFGAVAENGYLRGLKAQAEGINAVFAGFVKPEDLPFYYAAADISVVPSVWGEPFGKVATEAMACGLPVVGSRRGAIPEQVLDGKTGILVDDPADADALAGAMTTLLGDAALRGAMGRAGRQRAVRIFATAFRIRQIRAFYRALQQGATECASAT